MASLANLQRATKASGPPSRSGCMPGDAFVSAVILLQLGSFQQFCSIVRFEDAVVWFETHAEELDGEIVKLWHHAKLRAGVRCARRAQAARTRFGRDN